jgi:prepilin-type N-terminal cleavage/methylation domain-containing protein
MEPNVKTLNIHNRRGFTLIELLIVLGMLAVVMAAVYSLYSTHQQSAYTQDAVVELQQNLRIGMDSISSDIKMAGFLIRSGSPPPNNTPVNAVGDNTGIPQTLPFPGGNSDTLTINVTTGAVAKIAQDRTGLGTFVVDLPESVDRFLLNDVVTIIRPLKPVTQPAGIGVNFTVGAPNRAARTIPLSGAGGAVDFKAGDLIVRAPYPSVITYCLVSTTAACNGNLAPTCPAGQLCLGKIDENGNLLVIAQNVTGLQFSYLMDTPPGAELNAPILASYNLIHAVRVTLFGQTPADAQGNIRQRQMDSVIEVRNR